MPDFKHKLNDYFSGLKSIWAINPILIILLNALNQYGNNMKTVFRTLTASQDLSLGPAIIGTAISLYSICGILMRSPSGIILDKFKYRLKPVLIVTFLLRGVVWLGFGFVSSRNGYYVIMALDGIMYSMLGTMLPALMAISVDRKVMGSGFAIMSGITNLLCGTSRTLGATLYNSSGIEAVSMVASVTAFAAAGVVIFLRSSPAPDERAGALLDGSGKRSGIRGGILVKMLPYCIIGTLPTLCLFAENGFFANFASEEGYDYFTAQSISDTLGGVMNILGGFIVDMCNPVAFEAIGIAGYAAAPLIFALGRSERAINIGVWLFNISGFYSVIYKSNGMKLVSKAAQGAYSATMSIVFDVLSLFSSAVLGLLVEHTSYRTMYLAVGIIVMAIAPAYIVLDRTYLKKLRTGSAETDAKVSNNVGTGRIVT